MLRIEHLTKTYGEKKAVDDLSLHIAPGEIYGFIGHNGAGKTTTLKSIAGILQFDAGDIRIGGISIREDPLACKRLMAYIPDNPDLYEYMTGIKYLNFIADIFGVSADDRQARIRDYAARFELTDDLAQPIAAYSHGMKQKLAIISAWLHQPRLILMDEPFAGNDVFNREDFYKVLLGILEPNETIVLSTHLIEEVSGFLGRAVLLHKGQIVGDAQLSDLEEQGQTLMDYVKSSYHYQSDRVSRALSDLTGKEDTDA